MARYARLKPWNLDQQRDIAKTMCFFFAPQNYDTICKILEKTKVPGKVFPFGVMDFLTFCKKNGQDFFPHIQNIRLLAQNLERANIIQKISSAPMNEMYYCSIEMTNRQIKGDLWLGPALGLPFIAHSIKGNIVFITGYTEKNDISVGTGVLVSEKIILTCAHVINDMKIDDYVEMSGNKLEIDKAITHKTVDIGIIILKNDVENKNKDLAFRESTMLESIVTMGYPPVPRATSPCIITQTGEICGHVLETMEHHPIDLFSSIARPGNSGGPVIGIDGCILGIVARSLERKKEEADAMAPIPFFSSIPSIVIKKCVSEITSNSMEIPWEDYR